MEFRPQPEISKSDVEKMGDVFLDLAGRIGLKINELAFECGEADPENPTNPGFIEKSGLLREQLNNLQQLFSLIQQKGTDIDKLRDWNQITTKIELLLGNK